MRSHRPALGLLVVTDGALLFALRPDPSALVQGLTAPRQWLAEAGADRVLVVVAGAGLWCAAAWVAVGLLAAALARLPGTAGAVATGIANQALPVALRKIVIGSAGLGVLLTPISPLAAGAQPPDVSGGRPVATATPLPGPSWPGSGSPPRSAPLPAGPSWPGNTQPDPTPTPTHAAPTPTSTPSSAPPTTPRPTTPPPPHRTPAATPTPPTPPTTPRPDTPRRRATRPGAEHTKVRAGDCLWLLAAHRLGPHAAAADVADYLPELYAANRDVIGDDPGLVRPGQVLALPAPGPSTEPQESP